MLSHTVRRHLRWSPLISCAALVIVTLDPVIASATVLADVTDPELFRYQKVYQFTPTASQNWNTSSYYTTDNSGTLVLPLGFSRIGYYMELQAGAGPRQWVWVSMNAFSNNLSKIGVPNTTVGIVRNFGNTTISNMNVESNVAGIVTGTGIATGNIEFWPSNYAGTNSYGVPNATASYDFGDGGESTAAGYGSMQIHNYDLDGGGPGTAGQTLFGYSGWGGFTGDLGIGNSPGPGDWTLTNTASAFTLRNIEIWVLNDAIKVPEPSSLTLLGLGVVGMAIKQRRRRIAMGG